MRVHFIAIGGAAMHNLAIALKLKGFNVTGSDDFIYEPSKSRLQNHGILPEHDGWQPDLITQDIDAIILGMHARLDNPELIKAQELNLPIYSYPEYIYQQSKEKKRVVIGGSHGKTTITSMILHVLNFHKKDFDYLVGAQIEGFENMVKLSDAPIIIIEGDEYLASPIDRRPKFHLYQAHTGVISGVAWDHINVFPTFESYKEQFSIFMDTIEQSGKLIFCAEDEVLADIVKTHQFSNNLSIIPYQTPDYQIINGNTSLNTDFGPFQLSVFGKHNLMNLTAARLVCEDLGISSVAFYQAIQSFKGAARRLEKIGESENATIFKDFAHSPSKLKATIDAVKEQFPDRKLIACIELHTFSSLNEDFLTQYANTMNGADFAIVFIDEKTFIQKKMQPFSELKVKKAFNNNEIKFFNHPEKIKSYLQTFQFENINLLMMSSGNFGGIDLVMLKKLLLND